MAIDNEVVLWSAAFIPVALQDPNDRNYCVPIPCRRWHTVQLADLAKIAVVFMRRRYTPNTNWPSDAITRTNHSPAEGNVTGSDARTPPAFARILTNRTRSGGDGSVPNGFSVSSRIRSRPSHSTISASNGSSRSNAVRNFARDPGLRTTKV